MSFWQENNIEPKRGYRFTLGITGREGGIKQYLIKTVKKPGYEIGTQSHKFLNHTFHYPGRVTWSKVSFTIVDTVDPSSNGTLELMKILQDSGFDLPEPISGGGKGLTSISKAEACSVVGRVEIKTLDAEGKEVEVWVLNNAWISGATFGELSYESETLLEVAVTMEYDNAYVQTPGNANVPFYPGGPLS